MAEIEIQVIQTDYYLSQPIPIESKIPNIPISNLYQHSSIVPVIRIFGSTKSGQKACVHIHGVFPYFYIHSENDILFKDSKRLSNFLPLLANEIKNNLSIRNENNNKKQDIVAKLMIVKAISFYGCHDQEELFIKVAVYDPSNIRKIVLLLQNGKLFNKRFQVYEAHIPYLLQFFADYNIDGMEFIKLKNIKFRKPLPIHQSHMIKNKSQEDSNSNNKIWIYSNAKDNIISQENINENLNLYQDGRSWIYNIWNNKNYNEIIDFNNRWKKNSTKYWSTRQSICCLEIDVSQENILNQLIEYNNNNNNNLYSSLSYSNNNIKNKKNYYVPSLAAIIQEEEKRQELKLNVSKPFSPIEPTPEIIRQYNPILLDNSFSEEMDYSSAFSQSFFYNQMHQSLGKILNKLKNDHQMQNNNLGNTNDSNQLDNPKVIDNNENILTATQSGRMDSNILFSPLEHINRKTIEIKERNNNNNLNNQSYYSAELNPIAKKLINTLDEISNEKSTNLLSNDTLINKKILYQNNKIEDNNLNDEMDGNDILQSQFELYNNNNNSTNVLNVEILNKKGDNVNVNTKELINKNILMKDNSISIRSNTKNEDIYCNSKQKYSNVLLRNRREDKTVYQNTITYKVCRSPPTRKEVINKLKTMDIMHIKPFFSKTEDLPLKPLSFAGKKILLEDNTIKFLKEFHHLDCSFHLAENTNHRIDYNKSNIIRVRTPILSPPSTKEVLKWITEKKSVEDKNKKIQLNNKKLVLPSTLPPCLCFISIEIHVNTRIDFLPDPLYDSVSCICLFIQTTEGNNKELIQEQIIIMIKEKQMKNNTYYSNNTFIYSVLNEKMLIEQFILIIAKYDPDIICGFELQKLSLGYLIDRASFHNINLVQIISRIPMEKINSMNLLREDEFFMKNMKQKYNDDNNNNNEDLDNNNDMDEDNENINKKENKKIAEQFPNMNRAGGIWITGRYVLNLWRIFRSEINISLYTFENIILHVFKQRIPVYSYNILTEWYHSTSGNIQWRVLQYYLTRAKFNLLLLDKLEIITRTSEMARLFGIDFFSVLSRGSQYRVESVILRVTKKCNYLLLSPNRMDVANQAPMECIPLVMEPESKFYSDPVVVLDFQSLYPSMVIAYNLCYSTMLGRLTKGYDDHLENHLGVFLNYFPSNSMLLKSDKNTIITPNGALFCPPNIRKGIIPVVLHEILQTRIIVKRSMKEAKKNGDIYFEKILYARQLALKLLANVTYGYTAAGFSGRMPCAQLADAIVQSGRMTLENTIETIEKTKKWNAKVIYGDTDSVFVLLPGKSLKSAFEIGKDIAQKISAANPAPVELKLEKVYMGCVLIAKKRYIGYKYESIYDKNGIIESKGIETIRRDSCPLVSKLMNKTMKELFINRDLSNIKKIITNYWNNMMKESKKITLSDYMFAKEVRLGTYKSTTLPPAALVIIKLMKKDRRFEPRYAERVPYFVVNGPPGSRLIDLVVTPLEFFHSKNKLSINIHYYITKQIIPAMERILLLIGVDIRQWYLHLPRITPKSFSIQSNDSFNDVKKAKSNLNTIQDYFSTRHCFFCNKLNSTIFCMECIKNKQEIAFYIYKKNHKIENESIQLSKICSQCCAYPGNHLFDFYCQNYQCTILQRRKTLEIKKNTLNIVISNIKQMKDIGYDYEEAF